MTFQIPKQPYSGKIGRTTIGTGHRAVSFGGSDAYPFLFFEGSATEPPKIGMEVWDCDPATDWPEALTAPFKEVIACPEAWAAKCVEVYGAEFIVVHLRSTDPNGMDRAGEEAAAVLKRVVETVAVPVIAWGTANHTTDEEALKRVAERCQGRNLGLAPVEEANYKGVGAAALAYDHTIIASSPIDVNLAKQLNIMLGNLGLPADRIVIDPTTGGLGYGLEYTYSVMERIRMAALTQEDEKLQMPMICNVGREVWKSKEAGQSLESAPSFGDPEKRGILMEATAAVSYLLAGADAVVLLHPEAVRLVREYVQSMIGGGPMGPVKGIAKILKPPLHGAIPGKPEAPARKTIPKSKERAPSAARAESGKKTDGAPGRRVERESKAAGEPECVMPSRATEKAAGARKAAPVPGVAPGEPESVVNRLTRHLARMHRRS